MSSPLSVEISPLAAEHIQELEVWWRWNRTAAPNAVREELESALGLIALQPYSGPRAFDVDLKELLVRDLWKRYAPKKPGPAVLTARNVAEENATVDRYEREAARLKTAILRLVVTDEWRTTFPAAEHERIEQARRVIIAHGGHMVDWQE